LNANNTNTTYSARSVHSLANLIYRFIINRLIFRLEITYHKTFSTNKLKMESNNNNDNNNDGGNHQQLRGSAQNCKSNKLANDEDKPAAKGEDQDCSSNKNLEEGNDLDLEVCI
jgi:hypothetical protein